MSRFHSLPAALLGALLVSAPSLFAAASDVVQLPTLSVNEQAVQTADRPTTVDLAGLPSSGETFSDLAREAPGLSWNEAGARGFGLTVSLRGLGNTPFFGDASVPVYLDDIPLANAFTFPTNLFDFARVNVYRGPQSATRFGRAGDGGVIQLVSPEPGAQPAGHLAFSAGDFGALAFTASEMSARGDALDASTSVGFTRRDGYIRNTQLNTDVDPQKSVFGRFRLRYRPARDWEISLHLIADRDRDGAEALVPLGKSFDSVSRGKEGETDSQFGAAALGISRRLADGTLTATSSVASWELFPYSNRLVLFGSNLDSSIDQAQHGFNEEIKYTSDDTIVGALYSRLATRGGANRTFFGFPYENSTFQIDADTFALYGRRSFALARGWVLVPGLRFDATQKDFVRREKVPATAALDESNSWNSFSPSLTLSRRVGANDELSFTLARGSKAGGYSAYTGVASLAEFGPQRTWGLEAAYTAKGGAPDWTLTARAYAYRVRGYQIERSFAVPTTSTNEYLVVNADRARLLGFELESAWTPVRDVTITASGALTQSTLDSFTDPFTHANYSGDRVPLSPSGTAALRLAYHPAEGFFAGADVMWTGTTFYDEHETASLAQRAYTLADAYAGYACAAGSLRVFGRNLANEHYYQSITPGVVHGTPGAPFTWGVEYDYHW